jgi:hypothetical protein
MVLGEAEVVDMAGGDHSNGLGGRCPWIFPHTIIRSSLSLVTVPRSPSTSREHTLSLQGGCDVDGYQEGGDRVEDASEYE